LAASSMATIFGCDVSYFPQMYLGLPLSTHKLRLAGKKTLPPPPKKFALLSSTQSSQKATWDFLAGRVAPFP
jgi:hypothetical protein